MALDPSQLRPVLVVAGDPEHRRRLCAALEADDLQVVETATASAASRIVGSAEPSCVVVLDGTEGIDAALVASWRSSGARMPVVVLAAGDRASRWTDVADEWLHGDMPTDQVAARVRRRVGLGSPDRIALEAGVVDLKRRVLEGAGRQVSLTAREVDLLAFLAAHPSRTVTKDALLREVWGWKPNLVTRAVDQAVRRLRERIELDPSNPRHVLTVHGEGYRFEPLTESTPSPPVMAPVTDPERFGRYSIRRPLGRGGSGVVYRADLHGPGGFVKSVALKLLRDPADVTALLDEARVAARLRHPNVVDVYDVGVERGRAFVAMECVDGLSARELWQALGVLPVDAAIELVEAAAAGAGHAHQAGVVHLDLKPGNVLLGARGEVKIADFGLARAADRDGKGIGGTPGFVSPEVLWGQVPDARADVFSLGLVLALLALGRLPWTGETLLAWRQVVDAGVVASKPGLEADLEVLRPGLGVLVARCLATDRERRPADGVELAAALRPLRRGDGALLTTVARALGTAPPPEPPPMEPRATGLAVPADAFVGRAEETAQLDAMVAAGARLVTLQGPGGVGKTRLVRTWARAARPAGSVRAVDLEEVPEELGLVAAVGRALSIRLEAEHTDRQVHEIGSALAASGPTTIVLDGAERWADPLAEALGHWLGACPEAVFLVTSRRRLGVAGEQVLPVGPLPPADARALFVARARALQPAFAPEPPGPLAELVEALDHLPLALELAASRVRVLGVAGVLERLKDRFRLLARPDGPARHATLRATLDSTFDLLAPADRVALLQLAAFAGPFAVGAAERVLDLSGVPEAPWSLFALESLVDWSLLRQVEPGRLGMGPQVQEYVLLRATEHPLALSRARDRHAQHYASAPRDPADLDEVVVALRYARSTGAGALAADLARRAADLLRETGPFARAEGLLRDALQLDLDIVDRTRVGAALCDALRLLGRVEAAVALADELIPAARAAHVEFRWVFSIAEVRALALREAGRVDEAFAALSELEAETRPKGDPALLGSVLANLAWIRRGQGHTDDSVFAQMADALASLREAGDFRREASLLSELGSLHRMVGRRDEAERCYRASLALHQRAANRSGAAVTLHNLAVVLGATGRREESVALYRESAALHHQIGRAAMEGATLAAMAAALAEDGQVEEARRTIDRALALAVVGPVHLRGGTLKECGVALWRLGDLERARDQLQEAARVFEAGGYGHPAAIALCELGEIALAAGDPTAARELHGRAVERAEKLSAPQDGQLARLIRRLGEQLG